MSGAPILFLVLGRPTEDAEKPLILSRLSRELKTWNEHLSGCKLDAELESIIQTNVVEVKRGCRELVLTSERLSLVVLYDPTLAALGLFSKRFLAVKSCYRQLIYSGPALGECGSWLLQDGVLQFTDLARMLKDLEMPDFEPFYVNAFDVGKWTQENIEKSTSLCIKLNPEVQEGFLEVGCGKLLRAIGHLFEEEDLSFPESLEEGGKFSISCFGFPNQNCNLLKIGDFKMFLNADATKLPPRFYNGSDLVFSMTTDLRSLKWLRSCFEAEEKFHFGMLYSNALASISRKALDSAETSEKGLLVEVSDALKSLLGKLDDANIPVQSCFSSTHLQPTTIYHKAGFGTLKLYPITPSKEARDPAKIQSNESIISSFPSSSCALLWQPFNKKSQPVRLFFGGLVPQQALLEGLVKLKNVPSFSSWEGLSLEESNNKINKLKSQSKVAPEKGGQVNGNASKAKETTKAAAKQKATDSSSATSHSGHGDGTAAAPKAQPKSKVVKNEADAAVQKLERSDKAAKNSSVLSTPGKSEPAKQPLPRNRLSLGPLAQKAPAKLINRDATSTKPPAASSKPLATTAIKESAKQAQTSKPPATKPVKESKAASKAPPASKPAKPTKSTSAQQKKEQSAPEKTKMESVQKKAKSQKSEEKKDAEKVEEKEVKVDAEVILATSNIEAIPVVSAIKDDHQTIPEVAKLDESSVVSEVSATASSAGKESDQLISLQEQQEVQAGVVVPCEEIHAEEKVCSEAGSENEPDAAAFTVAAELGVPSDDVDEDSLGNETDGDRHDLEREADVLECGTEGEEFGEEAGPVEGNIPEPARPNVADEMIRSGISLAESAGTESAPNENLYSQDFEEESTPEEEEQEEEGEDARQLEKTLVQPEKTLVQPEDGKSELKSILLPDDDDSNEGETGDTEECIEKDVIEELEKEIEPKESQISSVEKHKESLCDEVGDKEGDLSEPMLLENEKRLVGESEVCDVNPEEVLVELDGVMPSNLGGDMFGKIHFSAGHEFGAEGTMKDEPKMEHKEEQLDAHPVDASEPQREFPADKCEENLSCDLQLDPKAETLKSCDLGNEVSHCPEESEESQEHVSSCEAAAISDAEVNLEIFNFEEQRGERPDQSEDVEGGAAPKEQPDFGPDEVAVQVGVECPLVDLGPSEDPVGVSQIKKEVGMEDLASVCREENPSLSSENFFSESADSITAVAGSVSEPRLSGSDEDKYSRGDYEQCCRQIADHLNIIKEHRDAVEKELSTNDVVFYNKNVTFHKEQTDELSEEDQDELETISEHPEIEEEEELLMNKDEATQDGHVPFPDRGVREGEAVSEQLIDFDEYLTKGVSHSLADPPQCQVADPPQCQVAEGVPSGPEDAKVDPFKKGVDDLSPVDVAPVHSSSAVDELMAAWGEPMKLPSPEKPKKLIPKKEGAVQEVNPVAVASDQGAKRKAKPTNENTSSKNVRATNKAKSSAEVKKSDPSQRGSSLSNPFYADVAFVYDRDDSRHATHGIDFFKKVRSRCYVVNASCLDVLDHLLEAKQTWDGPEVPNVVVVVNRMDWSKVEVWISSNGAALDRMRISVVPHVNQNIFESDFRLNTF